MSLGTTLKQVRKRQGLSRATVATGICAQCQVTRGPVSPVRHLPSRD